MELTFTLHPIPELVLAGDCLVTLGFTTGARFKLLLKYNALWISLVTDEQEWAELCEASPDQADLGADWVRDNGQIVIAGDWLEQLTITHAKQIEITTAPGVIGIWLQHSENSSAPQRVLH